METGNFVKRNDQLVTPVSDGNVVDTEEDKTTSNKTPDTNLVTPLNQTEKKEEKATGANQSNSNQSSEVSTQTTE